MLSSYYFLWLDENSLFVTPGPSHETNSYEPDDNKYSNTLRMSDSISYQFNECK